MDHPSEEEKAMPDTQQNKEGEMNMAGESH